MPRAGHLWETPFVELLRIALELHVTGRLDLAGDQVKRRLLLRDGLPVRARSNLLSENLFRFLLRRGLIDRTTYAELLGESSSGDRHRLLLERAVLPESQVEASDIALSEEITMACLGWTEASFTWTPLPEEQIEQSNRLNPFELYVRWLREQVAVDRVIGEAMRYRTRRFALSATGHTRARMVAKLLEDESCLSRGITERWTVQEFLDASSDRLDQSVVAFSALLHLGGLQLLGPVDSENDVQPPMHVSQRELRAVKPDTGHGRSRLSRVNKLVDSELQRVRTATSPYAVLGIGESATLHEAQETYRRLEEYYRPENFKVLGDESVLERVVELRAGLHTALMEILQEPPMSRPLPRSVSMMRVRRITRGFRLPGSGREDDGIRLASLLHADGLAYLYLGDFEEAADQFRQAHNHSGGHVRHLAYYGWAIYLNSGGDASERQRGKEAILEALRREPDSDQAHVLLGNLLSREGEMSGAAAAFERALALNPDNSEARAALDILS